MRWQFRVILLVTGMLAAAWRVASAAETLAPGQMLSARVVGTPATRLHLDLADGSAAELRLTQLEGAVELALEGGGADTLKVRTEAGRGGRLGMVLVGAARTPWVLSLTARRNRATIDLSFGPARPATATDRRRAAAFRSFAAAELLRREHYREQVVKTRTPAIDEQARGLYAAASEGYQLAQDSCGLRLARVGEARMEVAAGNYARARSLIETLLEASCDDDLAELAQAYKTFGMAAAYQGDFVPSVQAAEQALRLYRRTGDLFYQGVVLGNLSDVYLSMGDTAKALEASRGALTAAEAADDPPGVVYNRKGIAAIQLARGELAAALGSYRQTLVDLEKTPYPMIAGETWNDLGLLYHRMADHAESERCYQRAHAVWVEIKHTFGTVDTTLNEAEALVDRGAHRAAGTKFERALALAQQDGLKSPQVRALRGLGAVALAARDWTAARRFLTSSRDLAEEIGERSAHSSTLRALGELERAEGNLAAARAQYERALDLAREAADRAGVAMTLARLARTRSDVGDLDGARANIEEALEIIELQRGQINEPGLRTSFFAAARDVQELRIEILMRLDEARPGQGFAAAALGAAEQARARALQDSLRERSIEIRRDVDEGLAAAERAAEEGLRVAAFRLTKLPSSASSVDRDQARMAVDEANRTLDRARGRIRGASPRYAQVLLPEPLALEEVQTTLLDADSAALEYWLGERASYVWVVSRDNFRVLRLPGRAAIEQAANAYREALVEHPALGPGTGGVEALAQRERRATQRLAALSVRASRVLLGDALRGIPQRTLVVVADGTLQRVPFAGLRGADGGQLGRTREFVYLPSLSTLRWLRRASGRAAETGRVALLADPVFRLDPGRSAGAAHHAGSDVAPGESPARRTRSLDGSDSFDLTSLPPLPNSRQEARAIAALVPEERRWVALDYAATREAVLGTDWRQFSIVHFAAHALTDLQRPELSGIVLSLYDRRQLPKDGFLRLNDIYNLEMPARLVVLSACESALGKAIGSEGAFSLARAFFYAGTPRVIASLWPIDDRATARFMELFYKALLVDQLAVPRALRHAQLQMARQPRWSAPYYWAGFVLQGDWR